MDNIPKHIVKCAICNQKFDAAAEEFVKVSSTRYAHKACAIGGCRPDTEVPVKSERAQILDYAKELFGDNANYPVIQRQLARYTQELNFTYEGILNAIHYCYEVKKMGTAKSNGSFGIIEYLYVEAQKYYKSIEEANERNKRKNLQEYKPGERIIHISVPERKIKKSRWFSFLDREEN